MLFEVTIKSWLHEASVQCCCVRSNNSNNDWLLRAPVEVVCELQRHAALVVSSVFCSVMFIGQQRRRAPLIAVVNKIVLISTKVRRAARKCLLFAESLLAAAVFLISKPRVTKRFSLVRFIVFGTTPALALSALVTAFSPFTSPNFPKGL